MEKYLSRAVQEALRGSRKIKITFREVAKNKYLMNLLHMKNAGIVSLPKEADLDLMTIAYVGNWDSNPKRTLMVNLTDKFDENTFFETMGAAIENIQVINDN